MRVILKAMDADGRVSATTPLPLKDAVLKLWEFKTSGYVRVRAFDAVTNDEIPIQTLLNAPKQS